MSLISRYGEDTTVTHKRPDGTSVTIKSPKETQVDMMGLLGRGPSQGGEVPGNSPTPVADDVAARLTSGEFIMNVPATDMFRPQLEMMNQVGREKLAQGGWVNEPKPMGFFTGGAVSRGRNVARRAPPAAAPQVQLSNPILQQQTLQQPIQQVPPQEIQSYLNETLGPTPLSAPSLEQPPALDTSPFESGRPSSSDLKETNGEAVAKVGAETLGRDVSIATGVALNDATSVRSAIANLNKQAVKLGDKRKGIQSLIFGLSLLNGEGIANSIAIADKVGQMTTPELDEIAAKKKTFEQRILDLADREATASSPTASDVLAKPLVAYNDKGERLIVYGKKDGTGFIQQGGKPVPEGYVVQGELETDENIRQDREKALNDADTAAADTISSSNSLINQTSDTIDMVTDNLDQLGNPVDRTGLGQTIARNFGFNLGDANTELAVVESLQSQLDRQAADIVGQMRSKGVTFGAMSEAEWAKIQSQAGDIKGTLGGVIATQANLKAAAYSLRAKSFAYSDWREDPKNRGKSILSFNNWYSQSEQYENAKKASKTIAAEGLKLGRDVNAKKSGKGSAGQAKADSIWDKYK